METRMFFATLLGVFIFLAVAASFSTPVFYAAHVTGTTNVDVPGLPTNLSIYFNGAAGDQTINTGDVIIMALFNLTNTTFYLTVNMTGWETLSGNNSITNTTSFGSAGVYNITAWFPGDLNYSPNAKTNYLTITVPTPPPTPGGGGGGGGGAIPAGNVTTPKKEKTFEVATITGNIVSINGKNLDASSYFADTSGATNLPITGIGLLLRDGTEKLTILIERVEKPSGLRGLQEQYGLEEPYQYVKITVIGADPEAAFRTISMNFKVAKSWINTYNIDEGTITLYRYENGWKPLSAIRTGSNEEYSTFNAGDVRALSSYFAISAKHLIVMPTLLAPAYVVEPMTYAQLAVLVLAIILLILLLAKKRRKHRQLAIE